MEPYLRRRFFAKVRVAENGCWEWTGARDDDGYGYFRPPDGKIYRAHRVSYEICFGPIPDGLCTDHLCRNRSCVNPMHLEPVTWRENVLRGDTGPARNLAKTHCHKGHPLSGENLYVRPNGWRICKECRRQYKPKNRNHNRPSRSKAAVAARQAARG